MSKEDVSRSFVVSLVAEGAANSLAMIFATVPYLIARKITDALIDSPTLYLDMSGGVGWLRDFHVRTASHFVVVGHGTTGGPLREDSSGVIPAHELAARIRAHRAYRKSKPVLLLSCLVGAGYYPQQLSDALDAKVVASPDLVGLFGHTRPDDDSWTMRARWYRWSPDPPLSDIVGGSSVFVFRAGASAGGQLQQGGVQQGGGQRRTRRKRARP